MSAQREELRVAAGRVDALDKARQGMDTALDRFDFLSQQTERLEALQREREAIQAAVRENVPALQERVRHLRQFSRHLARLNKIEAARGTATSELQRLQSSQQELDSHIERGKTLNESIAQHEARVAALETKLRHYDIGDALGEWAAVARDGLTDAESQDQLDVAARAREHATARQRRDVISLGALILGLVVASVVVLPALVLYTRSLLITVIVGLVLSLVATAIVLVIAQRLFAISRELTRLTEQVGKIQGEANARRAIASSSAVRLEAARTRLTELGIAIPITPEAAQARRIEIAATLENKTRAELNAERDLEKEKLNYARAQRDEVVKRINDVTPLAASGNTADCQRVIQKSERLLNRWRPRIARRAAELDTILDLESAKETMRAAESELKSWQARIEQATKLELEIAKAEERTLKTRADIQAQYETARALLNGNNPAWDATFARTVYADVQQQLSEAFHAGGGEQVRARLNQVEKEFGASEREVKIREKNANDAVISAQAVLQDLNLANALDAEPTVEDLEELAERFEQISLDERPVLDARVKNLHQRVGALRDTRNRLERELGLQGETVDLNAGRDELEREREEQEIRKQATEIVLRARKRIVQKVLPATMDYMRRILPQLTRDRYHDAELDPETYKIRVWDERAGQSGAWKEKNIFSGGTKDQFSLALRLAFALATLPQERGASPGFIFLDEPLGSFDEERAAALMYLLTEGEIGHAFDQIFLISHVRVPENKFTHKLRLENGVVVENSLGT
jgi:DNA repair exonuclease SbcCD ATPase subunit